jgi:L-malate glycosyltransferase
MKMFYVSNLYPSLKHPAKGVFIKNVELNFISSGIDIVHRALLKGDFKNPLAKIYKYFQFYLEFFYFGLFKNDYDLIYVHFITHCALPVIIIKCISRKIIVLNAHGNDIIPMNFWCKTLQPLAIFAMNLSDLIVVPSNYFKEYIGKQHHRINLKLIVSPSGGIDCTTFYPMQNKQECKKKIGIVENQYVIGYVSRIYQGKGWDIFLEATSILMQQNVPIIGVIIGTGEQAGMLNNMIYSSKLDKNILYLGPKSPSMLNQLYNAFDVFVFPSMMESESLGLVGIEAMACGLPVIGSRTKPIQSYLIDGFNGILFSPGDSRQLSEIIMDFYNKKINIELLSTNALETAKKYDKKLVGAELKQILEEAVNLTMKKETIVK